MNTKTKIKKGKTQRGFRKFEFVDRYGAECSLQMSSLAEEAAIWLGCNDADPKVLVPGEGWQKVEMPPDYVANTRMHLTQKMVKQLLPALQKFAETGELP